MPSPYRQSDNTPPAPLDELEWRGRVGKSVRWAARLLLGEALLLVVTGLLPARFALAGAVVWFALGAALCVATWRLTAPRRGRRVGFGGWLLRGSVLAYLACASPLVLGTQLQLAGFISILLVAVAAMAHDARVLDLVDATDGAREARRAYWVLPLGAVFFWAFLANNHPVIPVWPVVGFFLLAITTRMGVRLHDTLLPVEHHWFFDGGMEPPGEWVSLFVCRDGDAEVWCMDEMVGSFWTRDEALEWLGENGYVPAERALAEHLVAAVPPDTVPRLRPRKVRAGKRKRRARGEKPRVRESAPRVRVAADAAEADPVDEPALDEAEPRRAVAVQKPEP